MRQRQQEQHYISQTSSHRKRPNALCSLHGENPTTFSTPGILTSSPDTFQIWLGKQQLERLPPRAPGAWSVQATCTPRSLSLMKSRHIHNHAYNYPSTLKVSDNDSPLTVAYSLWQMPAAERRRCQQTVDREKSGEKSRLWVVSFTILELYIYTDTVQWSSRSWSVQVTNYAPPNMRSTAEENEVEWLRGLMKPTIDISELFLR